MATHKQHAPVPPAPVVYLGGTVSDVARFVARIDPPYEAMDGGSGEIVSPPMERTELARYVTARLYELLPRLDAGQVPASIEIRRCEP